MKFSNITFFQYKLKIQWILIYKFTFTCTQEYNFFFSKDKIETNFKNKYKIFETNAIGHN